MKEMETANYIVWAYVGSIIAVHSSSPCQQPVRNVAGTAAITIPLGLNLFRAPNRAMQTLKNETQAREVADPGDTSVDLKSNYEWVPL